MSTRSKILHCGRDIGEKRTDTNGNEECRNVDSNGEGGEWGLCLEEVQPDEPRILGGDESTWAPQEEGQVEELPEFHPEERVMEAPTENAEDSAGNQSDGTPMDME